MTIEDFISRVSADKKYSGWKCISSHDRELRVEHEDGRWMHFRNSNIPGWIDQCWDDFTRLAANASTEWQPIETAPKDGREQILLKVPYNQDGVLAWSDTWWTSGFSAENKPTHWKPIIPE